MLTPVEANRDDINLCLTPLRFFLPSYLERFARKGKEEGGERNHRLPYPI